MQTIHQDMKPDNIMFKNGVAKIGDFGQSVRRMGQIGINPGNPEYQAPEIKNK